MDGDKVREVLLGGTRNLLGLMKTVMILTGVMASQVCVCVCVCVYATTDQLYTLNECSLSDVHYTSINTLKQQQNIHPLGEGNINAKILMLAS